MFPGSTSCSQFNGGCSHLCLPNPSGHQCFCPEGVQLKPGNAFICEGGEELEPSTVSKFSSHGCNVLKLLGEANRWLHPFTHLTRANTLNGSRENFKIYYHASFELTQNVQRFSIRAFIMRSFFSVAPATFWEHWRLSEIPFSSVFSVLPHLWISEKREELFFFLFTVNHCQQLHAPPNGSLEHCSNLPGQSCEFSCNKGYTLTGSTTRTCNSNGTWTGTPTQCNGNWPQLLFAFSIMILEEGLWGWVLWCGCISKKNQAGISLSPAAISLF